MNNDDIFDQLEQVLDSEESPVNRRSGSKKGSLGEKDPPLTTRVRIPVTKELFTQVEEYCKRTGKTVSELLNEITTRYIRDHFND